MPHRLDARQINVRYGSGLPPVLAEFSLALRAGQFVGVIGPNGSGKSTLVRALSRALRPEGGVVLLGERDLYEGRTAREAAQAIAVVPQDTAVSLEFSVRDVVRMGRAPHLPRRPFASETPADEQIVADALAAACVGELADRTVTTLSGGERQRALFARALAQQPDVLLLDEPTASLDLRHQTETLTLARNLAHTQGKAVLAVLHDVNQAAAYCDMLILLHQGRIAASGTPAEVLTAENLRAVYGADVWVRPHPLSGRPLVLPLPDLPDETCLATGPRVHVICGGGTGASLMLSLRRLNYEVTAACLSDGDPDSDAALLLDVPFASVPPFSPLPETALTEAARLAQPAAAVALTDMPFGPLNLASLEAALALRRAGKTVLCIQSEADFSRRDHTGGAAARLWSALLAAGAQVLPDTESVLRHLEAMEGIKVMEKNGSSD